MIPFETVIKPAPEPAPEPTPEFDLEFESDPESDPGSDSESDPKSDPESDPESGPESSDVIKQTRFEQATPTHKAVVKAKKATRDARGLRILGAVKNNDVIDDWTYPLKRLGYLLRGKPSPHFF
jgi:hypothetical protein